MEFRNAVLDNGLEIIAECNDEAHSQAMAFFVKTGSRDETEQIAGLSHFLEHMAFKGTPTRTVDDVNREFDEIGSHPNAYTSDEATVYHAAFLPEYQHRALALLSDLLRPALRKEDFETEKHVILEEIQMYEDQPPFLIDDKCKEAYFGEHPLGNSVLGTMESVSALTADQMQAYFDERYSPGNITLAAAGRVDFDKLVADAEILCGRWEPRETGRTIAKVKPQSGFHVQQKADTAQEYVVQCSEGPAGTDPARYAARVLTYILGDDSGSRLYWELMDPGLVDHVSLYYGGYMDAGLFMTYMSCEPGLAEENLQRVFDVYREAEALGITAEELAQAKSKLESRLVLGGERPRRRLFSVGRSWTQRGEYRSVKDELSAVDAVTLEDVMSVLRRYPLTETMMMCVGPLGELAPPR